MGDKPCNHIKIGSVDGNKEYSKDGKPMCHQLGLNYKNYKVHRIIWELTGKIIPAGFVVDHKDQNPSNNYTSNSRCVKQKVNTQNQPKRKNNISGKTGVNWAKTNRRGLYITSPSGIIILVREFQKHFPC